MRELTDPEIKNVQLNILKKIAEFCDKNDIKYYLNGGTLLGAVRHKGFIPWDDDIDIMIPRPDYLKLVNSFNGYDENYEIKAIENNSVFWRPAAQVVDNRTYIEEANVKNRPQPHGVFVDVFPIDGVPNSPIKRFFRFKTQWLLKVIYAGATCNFVVSKKYVDIDDSFGKLKTWFRTTMKYMAISIFNKIPSHKIIRLMNINAQKTSYNEADYVANFVDCIRDPYLEVLKKSDFEPRMQFDFEGEKVWGSKDYDTYLSNLYGDYMTPPQKDKQVSHHDFVAFWKDK